MKLDVNNPILKKGLGVASVVFAAIVAASNAMSDQKKDQEFEEMKKALSELQNQNKQEGTQVVLFYFYKNVL